MLLVSLFSVHAVQQFGYHCPFVQVVQSVCLSSNFRFKASTFAKKNSCLAISCQRCLLDTCGWLARFIRGLGGCCLRSGHGYNVFGRTAPRRGWLSTCKLAFFSESRLQKPEKQVILLVVLHSNNICCFHCMFEHPHWCRSCFLSGLHCLLMVQMNSATAFHKWILPCRFPCKTF